jgi:hypothetical protein
MASGKNKETDWSIPIKPTKKKEKINLKQLKKLCELQCTESEVCHFFGTNLPSLLKFIRKNTELESWSDFFGRYSSSGKISLRRVQYRKAIEHEDTTMQIWLGKQHLGQKANELPADPEEKEGMLKDLLDMLAERLPD